jgi:mannitol/fructose-specific phosphotransferase system IIA component (Ntr-type)
MICAILFLNLELLVKVASSVLILLYIFANLSVILFRESKILSYKPKFHSPFYPYLQILGILGGGFLLIEMGAFIVFLTTIFLLLGFIWYKVYAQKRASQDSALIYVLERLVARDKALTSDNLLTELRDIVVERDELAKDKFHKIIEQATVLDIEAPLKMEDFFSNISDILGKELNFNPKELFRKFWEREKESSTVVKKGMAIPHIIVEGKNITKTLLVRAKAGIIFPQDKIVHIIFVFVGSADDRVLHLKVLAAIAQITQNPEFDKNWLEASSKEELKNILLLSERRRS